MNGNDVAHQRPFSYEPLDDVEPTIRLLRFLPEDDDETLRCSLQLGCLTDDYIALSYAWGDASKLVTIVLNACLFEVRENLWQFLTRARKLWPTGTAFWIDAICINQADVVEKGPHVAMMDRIYAQANEVVAWLGSGDTVVQTAFNDITCFGGTWQDFIDSDTNWHILETYGKSLDFYMEAFRALDCLPYWGRLWIVQEILFASKLTFMYDERLMPSHCLETVWYYLLMSNAFQQYFYDSPTRGTTCIYVLDDLKRKREASGMGYSLENQPFSWRVFSLEQLIVKYRHHECAEQLDRVYALRALEPRAVKQIVVDYSANKCDVFMNVFEHFFREVALHRGIRLLSGLGLTVDDIVTHERSPQSVQWWTQKLMVNAIVLSSEERSDNRTVCSLKWRFPKVSQMSPRNLISIDHVASQVRVRRDDVLILLREVHLLCILRGDPANTGLPRELQPGYCMDAFIVLGWLYVDPVNVPWIQTRSGDPDLERPAGPLDLKVHPLTPGADDCRAFFVRPIKDLEFHEKSSLLNPFELHFSWQGLLQVWRYMLEDDTLLDDTKFSVVL